MAEQFLFMPGMDFCMPHFHQVHLYDNFFGNGSSVQWGKGTIKAEGLKRSLFAFNGYGDCK